MSSEFPFDEPDGDSHHFSNRLADVLINTRCSQRCQFVLSALLGTLAVLMQIPPIFLLNWVQINEPKAINQTDEKGDSLEAPFVFDLGYFGMCRIAAENMSGYPLLDVAAVRSAFPQLCVFNPFFTNDDLSDYSFAANVISARLAVPALLHIPGCFLSAIAVFLSIIGQYRRNAKTIISAIFYILGGLLIFAAVLQVICAVDDEMYPRMKPNAAGDPSPFAFRYGFFFFDFLILLGPSFLSTSLSFLPLQICVYLQTRLYFGRFPMPLDKAYIVPGLGEMIAEMITRSRRGGYPTSAPLSANAHRRDSRCSRDVAFGAVQTEVQRLVPPLTESLSSTKAAMHICV